LRGRHCTISREIRRAESCRGAGRAGEFETLNTNLDRFNDEPSRGSILVVDDEREVLTVVALFLRDKALKFSKLKQLRKRSISRAILPFASIALVGFSDDGH
jgi:hypothetical protein